MSTAPPFTSAAPAEAAPAKAGGAGAGDAARRLLSAAEAQRRALSGNFRDQLVQSLYEDAEAIARVVVRRPAGALRDIDRTVDRLVTSPIFGIPIMLGLFAIVIWMTVVGANVPSAIIASGLFWVEEKAAALTTALGAPWWLTGFVWHGVWRGLAWVVSVMLPPMAIFFPCFSILENLGYLPRVAFNLDWLFNKAGAHGKQSLTMSMGFGCNAAGVIACRIIDSPRERLIATLTNNFVPCNGRFPTLILLATLFVAPAFPAHWRTLAATGTVMLVVAIGVGVTLLVSALLSRTVLRGEPSAFTLELPPYRRPNIGQILYTSLIERTAFVLWRAILTAVPAGAVIWLLGNIPWGDGSLAGHLAEALNPAGRVFGLDGAILLAYIIAIPANEIVVPTLLMIYLGSGMMTELPGMSELSDTLTAGHGWTLLTAVNLMLFSLLHNPCGTAILTIWKETRSARWAALGTFGPLALAFAVTFVVAQLWRLFL